MIVTAKWAVRLVRDIVVMGFANGSLAISACILGLLAAGMLIAITQVSAPFVYALF